MTHTITPETITERIHDWQSRRSVDREQRTIGNVALAGRESRNGYAYSLEALREAVPLYENKPVFLDHPRDRLQARDRSTRDLAGSVVNTRLEDGRIRGDIRVLDTESGRTLMALVENDAPGVGMSHIVLAERSADGRVVERIHEVISVDVVVNPATTKTFQESCFLPAEPAATTTEASRFPVLQSEIATLKDLRQRLEEQIAEVAQQLAEIKQNLHIQHLIDSARLPPAAVTLQLREQLRHLPDDQSRRRLLSSQLQLFSERSPAPRSTDRASANSSAPADEQFLAALRRK